MLEAETYLNTLAMTAHPTKPCVASGLCRKRISSGAVPSRPRGIVSNNSRLLQEQTLSERPVIPEQNMGFASVFDFWCFTIQNMCREFPTDIKKLLVCWYVPITVTDIIKITNEFVSSYGCGCTIWQVSCYSSKM